MSRFKVGDEVYYVSTVTGNKRIGTVIKSVRIEDYPERNSIYANWNKEGVGWMPEDKVFLLNPLKSTGFEVGKKYRRINGVTIYEIIHLGETRVFYHTDHNQEGCIGKSLFHKFVEYIPPPPEEWRIVYKDRFGNVTVGKVPFKSESEAKASQFWTDHSDQDAFKTIRVDA